MKHILLALVMVVTTVLLTSCGTMGCCGSTVTYTSNDGCCGANSYTGIWY